MSSNIDINKFTSEPNDIIERLYKETDVNIMTQEDFNKLPLNKEYKENQEKKQKEILNNLNNNND
jgi:hypothetical protein